MGIEKAGAGRLGARLSCQEVKQIMIGLYTIDPDYCDMLRKTDFRVPMVRGGKERRPFVGVVLSINNHIYYAPLSSPKSKHANMNNQVDMMKIAGGKYGVINFNNMIPVKKIFLAKINLKPVENDSGKDIDYKAMLVNQLDWCEKNEEWIRKTAYQLYKLLRTQYAGKALKKRCCDFKKL
ncbi:MAG: type III toxin-antitoxin system ToxN/AbiQ family toxin, partial [Clostridiales Family XIII bacterium]|nr:type III toxin-antitoxin system ToxN/AbiQ family toxin [Clostridiales Family XIII bacterium]